MPLLIIPHTTRGATDLKESVLKQVQFGEDRGMEI